MHLKYTFETIELGDNIIAVPVGQESEKLHSIIKLNTTAAFIFNLLKEEKNETMIVDALEKEYDAPRNVLVDDVHKYLAEFEEKGLLVP